MSKAVFDKIAEGLQEALAVAKGEANPSHVTDIRWWDRALSDDEIAALARGEELPQNPR